MDSPLQASSLPFFSRPSLLIFIILLLLLPMACPMPSPSPSHSPYSHPPKPLPNNRPVVGIYTHPYYGPGVHPKPATGKKMPPSTASFLAASYVRMAQSGGALVVPVFWDSTEEELEKAFHSINLLIFPGGFTSLSPSRMYFKNAKKLLNLALEANGNGEYFAVHGTCLGFELLAALVSQQPKSSLLEKTDAMGFASKLIFSSENAKNKTFFGQMPKTLVARLQTARITMENHAFGIVPATISSNSKLESFFEILTTSEDRFGKEYVSTMASLHFPITATQWHPEKPPFEFFSALNVPHGQLSLQVSTAVTTFLIREARKSSHYVPKEELLKMVVDNYKFEFQAKLELHDYDSIYIFPTRTEREAILSKQESIATS